MKFGVNIHKMKKIFAGLVALGFLALPLVGFADTIDNTTNKGDTIDNTVNTNTSQNSNISFKITNPFNGGNDLTAIIKSILENIILPVGSVVIVVVIIFAGFKYLTAQGNPKAIQDANRTLLYALIGAAILLGAEGINLAVKNTVCQFISNCP